MRKAAVFCLTLCMAVMFQVPALAAQEPAFRIDMDNLNLQKGVSSSFVVSMINAQGAELVKIEGLEHFDVLSQSQSTSASIVNGTSTYQMDLHYTIMPKAEGQFTLKAVIQYDGKTYETNALQVTVGAAPSKEGEAESDLFVKTVLSRDEAYLGEKIVLTYELYSRYNIENFGFTDYTAIDGVIAKDMPEDQLKAEYVYLDGIRYAKYEAKQLILDPIKAGTLTIPSFKLQVNVVASGPGGLFGRILTRTQALYLQTEEKELTVKPLPSEGKPADFAGIVGSLQLEGHYSREEVQYGDSLTLQITASGSGNLDGLKKIFPGGLPGFTLYETQKNAAESVENGQYRVQKEFEVILVPEKTGVIEAAPVSIPYFNPDTGKYERAEIPGTAITVLGEMPAQTGSGGEGGQGGQQTAMETVRITQVNYAAANDGYLTIKMSKQVLYGVLIGLGVLLILAVAVIAFASKRKKRDAALKSLYRQLMASKDIHEVYRLFGDIIKHCYNLSLKASPQSEIRSRIPNAGLAAQVAEIMDYMESRENKDCSDLKAKIKRIYGMLST
jgi:hypothetical protein